MASSTVTDESGEVDQIPCNSETLVMSDATFLLRHVLEMPEDKLEGYIKRLTGPEVNCKMELCESCKEKVATAKLIYQEMIDAQRRFKELKFEISRKVILSEEGVVCGDKESEFLTFAKEIVKNHGRENLASSVEGNDLLSHGTSDMTDKQEGTPETEIDHVTTTSKSENVSLTEPELSGGIDMLNIGDLDAQLLRSSTSVINELWLNTEPKLEDDSMNESVEAISEPEVSRSLKIEAPTMESETEEDDCMLEIEYHFKEEPQYLPTGTLNSPNFANTMETENSSSEIESDEEGKVPDLLETSKSEARIAEITNDQESEHEPKIKVVPKPKRKKAAKFCLLATAKDPKAPHGLVMKGLKRIPRSIEGPVNCKCGKQFTNTGHLTRHVRESLASAKERSRCEICFQGEPSKLVTFKREEDLKCHVQRVHEGNHRSLCPKCGKLMYQNNLNRHLKRCGLKKK